MTTLATAIATRMRALIAPGTLADLTRQRTGGDGEVTAVTDAAAATAAALVVEYLGEDADADDAGAVSIGYEIARAILQDATLVGVPERETSYAAAIRRLETMREMRVAEFTGLRVDVPIRDPRTNRRWPLAGKDSDAARGEQWRSYP